MEVLGLRLNATYLGVVWDSTTMQACMSPARIEAILTAIMRVREGQSLTVKQFQRLLGLMAAASNVIPLGLLYMRPLQWWPPFKLIEEISDRHFTLKVIFLLPISSLKRVGDLQALSLGLYAQHGQSLSIP